MKKKNNLPPDEFIESDLNDDQNKLNEVGQDENVKKQKKPTKKELLAMLENQKTGKNLEGLIEPLTTSTFKQLAIISKYPFDNIEPTLKTSFDKSMSQTLAYYFGDNILNMPPHIQTLLFLGIIVLSTVAKGKNPVVQNTEPKENKKDEGFFKSDVNLSTGDK